MIRAVLVSSLVFVACAPSASPARPSPSPVSSQSPAPPATSAPAAGSPAASATPIPLPALGVVAPAGGGVVWMLVSDHLFLSRDRGDTWVERKLPPAQTGFIAFVSATEGWWLAPTTPGRDCALRSMTLWKTDDGAVSWRKLDAGGLDDVRCKTGIAFRDASTGYITVEERPAGRAAIYRTNDGGRTWSLAPSLRDPPGFTPAAGLSVGSIADFGDVLFADVYATSGGTVRHFAYRSTDRGATWSYASPAPQSASILFLAPTRWLQITVPGDSRETTDGGLTWHFFSTDYSQSAPVAPQIAFGDATSGYATVRGALQRTIDGGAHWRRLVTPGTQ